MRLGFSFRKRKSTVQKKTKNALVEKTTIAKSKILYMKGLKYIF